MAQTTHICRQLSTIAYLCHLFDGETLELCIDAVATIDTAAYLQHETTTIMTMYLVTHLHTVDTNSGSNKHTQPLAILMQQ